MVPLIARSRPLSIRQGARNQGGGTETLSSNESDEDEEREERMVKITPQMVKIANQIHWSRTGGLNAQSKISKYHKDSSR